MIDTHSHIYLPDFKDDLDQILERATQAGIEEIYLPNIDADSIPLLKSTAEKYSRCKPMMGLHPGSVKEDYQNQLALIFRELEEGTYYAVGEIGLDLYWDKTFQLEQEEAFALQIEKAKELQLPVVIHCREAFDPIFNILENHTDDRLWGIFHCFTGNEEQAHRAISLNMKLGIGGVLTFKNAGLDKVIKNIDLQHLVLETDAPYLAPAPYRGKRNEPSYLKLVAEKLSTIKKISLEEIDKITTYNAKQVFEK